ncbi:hypothetical protein KAR91_00490 [Candidatus Pacearchaeota archaeon]|nr:hypothetical protein [Candidatus Pacearchaeota archaeon]
MKSETRKRLRDAIQKAILHKGIESQFIALSEECGELLVAASHRRRGKVGRRAFLEEMQDVKMMIEEFEYIENATEEEIEELFEKKLQKFESQVAEY